jgi:hypothetical protein
MVALAPRRFFPSDCYCPMIADGRNEKERWEQKTHHNLAKWLLASGLKPARGVQLGVEQRRGRACPTLVDFRGGNQRDGKPSPYTAFGRVAQTLAVECLRSREARGRDSAARPCGRNQTCWASSTSRHSISPTASQSRPRRRVTSKLGLLRFGARFCSAGLAF